ncbi:di-trans,poly-cis-decaprenylcistransferase [Xylella taiwanensis]|uniref:Ditrans,polycis-undecaprenyl-diphosphate synthase ((2E,6E)-farnesyl-diphosphate specific) n=2 Tax=Xylella taiwanensis TaxID=1444770 RepID=Z9JGI5_9GAMM|nr:UDP diphosphate synthase [Xylella taiwanensis]EWS77304.1 UDP pyrophosphate synthase [Xylella taiwanensis]NBI37518.1 di-trans,poly-cis-decaprenylcistransferase [Xylella taiwanensis]QKD97828.1 di-trans,poly-cis-decaprenylcistransferase [Xylella taiwanensis]
MQINTMPMNPKLPRHIAIIMDGNGRWAERRSRPRTIGHRAGVRAALRTVDFCLDKGIGMLTLFAFSSENWNRPPEEVNFLMEMSIKLFDRGIEELHRRGVQVRFIGERTRFDIAIVEHMTKAEHLTAGNQRLILSLAASYGGRQDIAMAARALAQDVAAGQLKPEQIDEDVLGQRMALADLPPPDLFIRTSGVIRISNFLLWQLAYTELWFTDVMWPEFDSTVLQQALDDYASRERRFGLTNAQIAKRVQETTSA